jgi:hypothetical protein
MDDGSTWRTCENLAMIFLLADMRRNRASHSPLCIFEDSKKNGRMGSYSSATSICRLNIISAYITHGAGYGVGSKVMYSSRVWDIYTQA